MKGLRLLDAVLRMRAWPQRRLSPVRLRNQRGQLDTTTPGHAHAATSLAELAAPMAICSLLRRIRLRRFAPAGFLAYVTSRLTSTVERRSPLGVSGDPTGVLETALVPDGSRMASNSLRGVTGC